jgi:hypothetical protein
MDFLRISKDVKDIDPNEHKRIAIMTNNGLYGSVKNKQNKYVWKKYDEDKMMNAVNAFKFWNHDHSNIIHNRNTVEKLISNLKKDLKKENIMLFYKKNMGLWHDGELHFIDYLWDDVCNEIEEKHEDWTKCSFIMTDDIYVLDAMMLGKLTFQHNILKKDIEGINKVLNKYKTKSGKFKNSKSIILEL